MFQLNFSLQWLHWSIVELGTGARARSCFAGKLSEVFSTQMATAESKHADEAAAAAAATVPPVTSVEPTRPYLMELAASMQQQASAQPSVEANAQQIEDALMATAGDQAGRRGPLSRTSKFKGVTRHRRSGRSAQYPTEAFAGVPSSG